MHGGKKDKKKTQDRKDAVNDLIKRVMKYALYAVQVLNKIPEFKERKDKWVDKTLMIKETKRKMLEHRQKKEERQINAPFLIDRSDERLYEFARDQVTKRLKMDNTANVYDLSIKFLKINGFYFKHEFAK